MSFLSYTKHFVMSLRHLIIDKMCTVFTKLCVRECSFLVKNIFLEKSMEFYLKKTKLCP